MKERKRAFSLLLARLRRQGVDLKTLNLQELWQTFQEEMEQSKIHTK